MDKPPRPISPPPTETERALRTVTFAWLFGSVYFTAIAGAPLTKYADWLGATEFTFGLLSALPFMASLLSLPAAVLTDKTGQRKAIFVGAFLIQRLVWIGIAVVPVLAWQWSGPSAGLIAFLVLFGAAHAVGALGGPAYMSWMSNVVPRRVRGRYFANRRRIGIFTALPTALVVGYVMDRYGNADAAGVPWPIVAIFACAAVAGLVDILLFLRVPHEVPTREAKTPGLASLKAPLVDGKFLRFAAFVAVLTMSAAPVPQFVNLMLVRELELKSLAIQTMLLVMPMVSQMWSFNAWGRAVDRFGKKPVMAAAMAGIIPVAGGWAIVALNSGNGSPLWAVAAIGFVTSFMGGIFWSGIEVANTNYVLEMVGSRRDGSGYAAVNGVIVNVAGALGGLGFGVLATATRDWQIATPLGIVTTLAVVMLTSMGLRIVAAVVFLPFVAAEGGLRTRVAARETLRFVGSNLYNNAQSAMFLPLRVGRSRLRETSRIVRRVAKRRR
ncbi:MAG: MFS transporter [Planctomycetota bacterium]